MANSTVNKEETWLELEEWRKKIDELDHQLSELLCQRLDCAQNISDLKHRMGEQVLQPAREKEVLENVLNKADSKLKAHTLETIYRCIIEETRMFQNAWKQQRQHSS